MSSAVSELDKTLTLMVATKAGSSRSGIATITSLCTQHVKDEPVLIQKLYAHFKKAEASKKLGVLYAIDSVTRQWVEQARKAGQALGPGARDGTFAAGVTHVTELIPALMSDMAAVVPDSQRESVSKLIAIWEHAGTFHPTLCHSFREKLDAPAIQSTTPTTTPPPQALMSPRQNGTAAPAQSTSSILASLQALAAASKASSSQAPPPVPTSIPVQAYPTALLPLAAPQVVNPHTQGYGQPFPPVPPSFAAPIAIKTESSPAAIKTEPSPLAFPPPPSMYNAGASAVPPPPPTVGTGGPALQQQIMILQTLQANGVPQDQWAGILAMFSNGQAPPAVVPPPNFVPQNSEVRSRDAAHPAYEQPSRNVRSRSRSRSPRGRSNNNAGVNGRYRSPDRRRDTANGFGSGSQAHNDNGPPASGPKFFEYDATVPPGAIKVLSRTLFVGGVKCTDEELRNIFSQAGPVQSCNVTPHKQHAFVKMYRRKDAEKAQTMFEFYNAAEGQLRTRWGVGFGPRDACDYQLGVSTIPLDRLTDSDKKWAVTAEYGGTGGRELVAAICIEEPDIEMGHGVSSKGLSRRMQTDKSGDSGPRSSRQNETQQQQNYQQPKHQHNRQQNNQRFQKNQQHPQHQPAYQQHQQQQQQGQGQGRRRHDHRGHSKADTIPNVQVPPTVPSFGFQMPTGFSNGGK